MIRPLVLGPESEALAREVREYAERRENWFRPSAEWNRFQKSDRRPGNKPRHKVTIPLGYHCVFSWTVAKLTTGEPIVVRDLSVKVDGATPNPIGVFAIAELFGFTKRTDEMNQAMPHPRWQVGFDECDPPCVTVVEKAPTEAT